MAFRDPQRKRDHHREYMKTRYATDAAFRTRHKAAVAKNRQEYLERGRRLIEEWKSTGCQLCEETDPCCLVAHHKDPKQKDFTISQKKYASKKRLLVELEKCICVCMNCHAKIHAKRLRPLARGQVS